MSIPWLRQLVASPSPQAWVQSQASAYWIYGGQSGFELQSYSTTLIFLSVSLHQWSCVKFCLHKMPYNTANVNAMK
jgi:hypothetical protein